MTTKAKKQKVTEAVRKHLKDRHPGGATLEIVEQGIYKEETWWRVPVRPSFAPRRLYDLFEALADAEQALETKEKLTVILSAEEPNGAEPKKKLRRKS